MFSLSLMTALLMMTGIPETQLAEPGEKTSVSAGMGEFRKSEGVLHVEGGAVLNSGAVWLKADHIDYGVKDQSLSARGNLVIIDGNVVVTGQSGSLIVGQPETLKVQGATLYQKNEPLTADQLDSLATKATSPAAASDSPSAAEPSVESSIESKKSTGVASESEQGSSESSSISATLGEGSDRSADSSAAAGASTALSSGDTVSMGMSSSGVESVASSSSSSSSSSASSSSASSSEKSVSSEEKAEVGAPSTMARSSDESDDSIESVKVEETETEEDVRDISLRPEESPAQKEIWQRSSAMATCAAEDFRNLGSNGLIIKTEDLARTKDGYEAKNLRLTSCDCPGEDCPSWSLGASSASVTPGEGAWLWWPTFRIHDVPVFGFPVFYVPLSTRRTGFLFPKIEFSSSGGFGVDLPFFLTLGRSFDLTITAGFLTKPFLALSNRDVQRESAWGPRGTLEFRYAPHASTHGNVKFGGILDRGDESLGGIQKKRGFRGQFILKHRTELTSGFGLFADVGAIGDARYLSDISDNLLASATTYLPSVARIFLRKDDFELTLASQWFQDLAIARSGYFPEETLMVGRDSPATYQRPAVFLAQLPMKRLVGSLRVGGEFIASHIRPIGIGGTLTKDRLRASVGKPDAEDFYAVTRLDFAPKLWISLIPVGPIRGDLTVGARGDFTAYTPVLDEGGSSLTRLWGRAFADMKLWTELSRIFGNGDGALRHAIVPSIQLRGSTGEFGNRNEDLELADALSMVDGIVVALDELDATNRAARPRLFQGIAAVRSRLSRTNGDGALTLTLGQGFDFTEFELSESFGEIGTDFRWVSAGVGARFDPNLKRLSLIQGRIRITDPRGDYLSATYDLLWGSGTSLMRQGLDDLIGVAADTSINSRFQQINLGVGVSIIRQVALLYGIRIDPVAAKNDRILLHTGGLKLRGACNCWSLDLEADWAPVTQRWSAKILVTLKNLGSFGN